MGKMKDAIAKLVKNITGKEPANKDSISNLVSEIANGYELATIKKIETTNITTLTTEQLNALNCGDIVIKLTGEYKHSYRVSFKKDDEGICLTYSDASLVETVSYDLVEGEWVYNSTDSTTIGQ